MPHKYKNQPLQVYKPSRTYTPKLLTINNANVVTTKKGRFLVIETSVFCVLKNSKSH